MSPQKGRIGAFAVLLFLAAAVHCVLVELHRPSIVAYDVYAFFVPNTLHAIRSFWGGGDGLLWNPFQSGGTPFFGNSVTGLLYPPHALFLLLPLDLALHAVLILNMIIGAVGMLCLLREIGVGWIAAIGGALAFELGDPMVQLISWSPIHSGPWAWVPWAMLFCERLLRAPRVGNVIGLAVALALALLPGFVLITVLTYQLIVLRVAWEIVTRPSAGAWRAAAGVAAGLVLAPLLIAVQLLPAFEYASASWRITPVGAPRAPAVPVLTLAAERTLPVPFMVVPLLLAVLAPLARATRRVAVFYLAVAVLSALIAVGGESMLYRWYAGLPFMAATVRLQYRVFWVTGFCLAVLVAIALEVVADRDGSSRRERVALLGAAALGAALYWLAPGGLRSGELAAIVLIVSAVAIAVAQPAWRSLAAAVIVAAVGWNLVNVPLRWPGSLRESMQYLSRQADAFADIVPLVTAQDRIHLAAHVNDSLGLSLIEKSATVVRLPSWGDYEALYSERYARYSLEAWSKPGPAFQRLMNLAAIRYVVASPHADVTKVSLPLDGPLGTGSLRVFRNDGALARVRYVPRVEVVRDAAAMLDRLATGDDDLTQVALIEEELPSRFTGSSGASATVRVVTNDAEQLTVDVEAADRGFLVVADQFYPGWSATVNGADTPLVRGNYLFRLVEIPAGRSRVELRYRPASLTLGAVVSLVTVIGVILTVRIRSSAYRKETAGHWM